MMEEVPHVMRVYGYPGPDSILFASKDHAVAAHIIKAMNMNAGINPTYWMVAHYAKVLKWLRNKNGTTKLFDILENQFPDNPEVVDWILVNRVWLRKMLNQLKAKNR